jgi:hypothetical protein
MTDRILFIDDAQITSMRGVERRIHPARKHTNPVVTSDREWEGAETTLGTVREEDGRFRMWYQSYAMAPDPTGIDSYIRSLHLYAESDDGLAWSKPELGVTEDAMGSYANNITLVRTKFSRDTNPSILYRPHAPAGHAYTMLSYGSGYDLPYNGHFAAYSDNGLRWSDGPETPVIPGFEIGWFMYDEVDEKFRGLISYARWEAQLFATQSTDGLEWSLPRPVINRDEADTEWAGGDRSNNTFFPAMPIMRYGPMLLGFLQVLRGRVAGGGLDGEMDVQLVSSRDGKIWHRVGDRRPILERGGASNDESVESDESTDSLWDSGCVWMGNSLVEDGDRVVAYYTGCRRTPGALLRSQWPKSIGMASWPRDRLVGLVTRDGGVVETTATVAAGRLHVNAEASNGGLRAALLAEDGTPIEGFSVAACEPLVNGDTLDHLLEWKNGNLASLAGRTVRIHLELRNAELFSLCWEP